MFTPNFIKLHTTDGLPVWINPSHIVALSIRRESSDMDLSMQRVTLLTFQDGDYISVTQTPEEIIQRCSELTSSFIQSLLHTPLAEPS